MIFSIYDLATPYIVLAIFSSEISFMKLLISDKAGK